jgi:hypothetical protein
MIVFSSYVIGRAGFRVARLRRDGPADLHRWLRRKIDKDAVSTSAAAFAPAIIAQRLDDTIDAIGQRDLGQAPATPVFGPLETVPVTCNHWLHVSGLTCYLRLQIRDERVGDRRVLPHSDPAAGDGRRRLGRKGIADARTEPNRLDQAARAMAELAAGDGAAPRGITLTSSESGADRLVEQIPRRGEDREG